MKKRRVRELVAERFVLREPGGGRVRAVLNTKPGPPGRAPGVRLAMYAPDGTVALLIRVSGKGEPRVYVGPPGCHEAVVVYTHGVHVWAGGSVVAALDDTR